MNGKQKRLDAKLKALQFAASLAGNTETIFAFEEENEEIIELIEKELRKIANRLQNHAEKLAKKNNLKIEKYRY